MNPMYDLVVIAIIVVSVMSNLYYSRIPETEQVVSLVRNVKDSAGVLFKLKTHW